MTFTETADIETSSDGYAKRFSGKTGAWMLSVQEQITLDFLRRIAPDSVLDVGGGHGQLAIPIAGAGIPVTVIGSAPSCRSRLESVLSSGKCRFEVGDVVNLPYPDDAFHTVICFRLLTHCSDWPRLIAELCRVARAHVIIDYPTTQSVNAIAPALFKAKKRIEGDTRTWSLFAHRQVSEVFEANGFKVSERKGQFCLPMVLHRTIRFQPLSSAMEAVCRALGLTRLLGSPVIIKADRTTGQ